MNVDITKLNSNYVNALPVSFTYSFSEEELKGTDLIKLDAIKIEGEIKTSHDDYEVLLEVSGTMVLPCAITLEPVEYPFIVQIDEYFNEFMEESLENGKKIENKLDIFPIIWENILMEIPTKVVSEKAKNSKLEGNGWKLITEEEEMKNHAFEKLNDLLK